MPNSLQTLDTSFPKIDNHQTTQENFLQVTNYLYMLLENLRYTLGNLGGENFNVTELDSIAQLIREPVWARIEDTEGNVNTLNVTAENLLSQMSSLDGSMSTLQQTSNTLMTRVQDAEGNLSSLTQTVYGMTLSVTNGTSSSTIQLMQDGVAISSKTIQFTGMVTFSDLSTQNSKTVIHGGNITTGSIKAIDIYGSRFYNTGGKTWMEVGKDLDGADNDAFALYVSHKNYADTGVFSVFNGDGGVVTFGAKGFSFLGVDANLSVKKVKILVGSDGKYWEFSTTGIKFLDKNDNVINRVTLDN